MTKRFLTLIFLFCALSSCLLPSDKGKVSLNLSSKDQEARDRNRSVRASVDQVKLVNDEIVITGTDLDGVTKVKITQSGSDSLLSIVSKSATKLILSSSSKVALALNTLMTLTLEDAYGAAVIEVTFNLPDSSVSTAKIGDDQVTTAKIADGAITSVKLSSMGALTGQLLRWNGSSWVAADLDALTYAGTWDASVGGNPNPSAVGGEYYIVSNDGVSDPGDGNSRSWSQGDWIVYNDVTATWDQISNSSDVTSFNGRTGGIVPTTGDYTWAQIDKSTSSIGDISDVDLTTIAPSAGKILKYDGSQWVVGDDLSGGGAGSVSSTEIADGAIVDADVSGSAAIAWSKIDKTGATNSDVGLGNVDNIQQMPLSYLDQAATLGTDANKVPSQNAVKTYVDNATSGMGSVTSITGGAALSDGPYTTTGTIDVQVDNSTIEVATDALQLKDGGITNAKINASAAISWSKIDKTGATNSDVGLGNVDNIQQMPLSYLDQTVALGTDANKVPSQNAVKTYVDNQVGGVNQSQWTTNASDIYYNSGNVGIGTINPYSPLSIIETNVGSFSSALDLTSLSTTTGTGTGLRFKVAGDGSNIRFKSGIIFENTTSGGRGDLHILNDGANDTGSIDLASDIAMTIKSNKNIGIGTTNPSSLLDVNGIITANGFDGPLTSSTTSVASGTASSPSYTFSSDTDTGFYSGSADTIEVTVGGTNIFDMTSTSIASTSAGGGVLRTSSSSASDPTFSFSGDEDTGWFSPAANTLAATTGGVERIRIDDAGNIGVGVSNPEATLDVDGGLIFRGLSVGSSGGTRRYWKLFTLDGVSSTSGAGVSAIISGTGDYGNRERGMVFLQVGEREDELSIQAYHLNVDKTSDQIELYYKKLSPYEYEVWALVADYNQNHGLMINHLRNTVVNAYDPSSVTTTVPTGLVAADIKKIIADDGTGNVGIGTNSPAAKLDVVGSGSDGHIRVGDGTNSISLRYDGANFLFSPSGTGNVLHGYNSGTSRSFQFYPSGTTTPQVSFLGSGNVGIGVPNPTTKLEVNGTVKATGFDGPISSSTISANGGSAAAPSYTFSSDTDTGFYSSSADTIEVSSGGSRIFDFSSSGLVSANSGGASLSSANGTATNPTFSFSGDEDTGWYSPAANILAASTGGDEKVRITETGKLGIGTTNPSGNIEISQDSGDSFGLVINAISTQNPNFNFSEAGAAKWNFGYDLANDYFKIAESGIGDRLVIEDTTGNVGIGTITPGALLHVNGSTIFNTGDGSSPFKLTRTPTTNDQYIETTVEDGTVTYKYSNDEHTSKIKYILENTDLETGGGADASTQESFTIFANKEGSRIGIDQLNPTSSIHVSQENPVMNLENKDPVLGSGSTIEFGHNQDTSDSPIASIHSYLINGSNAGRAGELVFSTTTANTLSEAMRIDESGNVGIGTDSPSELLEIAGIGETIFVINADTDNVNEDENPGIHLLQDGGNVGTKLGFIDGLNSGNTFSIGRRYGGTDYPESITLNTANGHVGIGTQTPEEMLTVEGGDFYLKGTELTQFRMYNASDAIDPNDFWMFEHHDNGQLKIMRRDDSGATWGQNLVLSDDGMVGIGTSSPIETLHVNGDLYVQGKDIWFSNDGATDGNNDYIAYDDTTYLGSAGVFIFEADSARVRDYTTPTGAIAAKGAYFAGNVGIGTTSPAEKLDVYGNIAVSGSTVHTSDRRLKRDIASIEKPLEKVNQLNGVTYHWKDHLKDKHRQIGVIAQDVQEQFPEAVYENKETGFLSVNYSGLIGPLIESIKELYRKWMGHDEQLDSNKREIASLKDENEAIRNELDEVKRKNQKMEEYLCAQDPQAPFCP
tara:strand:+ start:175850 stop:181342 length:5493 start_codon:yes stop_codon:yes gene_type:complete